MERIRIGRRIKAFRKLKGFTQAEFAKVIGVSLNELGAVERGTRDISEAIIERTADTLNIEKQELLGKMEE
ncbi:helix-turn-helix domain-containing protein [Ornithinibacillus contaminans]|uniref:helix-turn-helix domain-containing protein n=1 Tax=Ornithinibacillus contaminans TaxID=694055 RepID=UPI00064E06D9|nr:helix-turn-helix transcriptional regulator [Ornithinibacillus contaminans]